MNLLMEIGLIGILVLILIVALSFIIKGIMK